jgi:ribonucleoside-diphosphate reductase beta chain
MSSHPLFNDDPSRFTVFPIKQPEIWAMAKKAESSIWHAADLNLIQDREDWSRLNKDQQHFIKYVLAFFAGSDGIVNENLAVSFMREVKSPEARHFYSVQNFIENVHAETYSQLIDTYISDAAEREKLFGAIANVPCIAKKAAWAMKWINYGSNDNSLDNNVNVITKTFAQRLVAFAAVEGIFFSGSFCAIYWINELGIMRGLCAANEYIARDEGMHTDFACLLYGTISRGDDPELKLSEAAAHAIIDEAVQIEMEFITEALPCKLIGMNADSMKEYIKFVADRLAQQLGFAKLYNVRQPFEFMNRISLMNKSNFFETKPTDYKKQVHSDTADPYKDLFD